MTPTEFACPICRRMSEPANQIFVCAPCHGDLIAKGQVSLTSTSEFAAMTPAAAAAILADSTPVSTKKAVSCTWCGKSKDAAKKMLSSRDAHICNECVALCAEILTVELGNDWR